MNIDFKSIPQESTAELLAESLRQAILDGQLTSGTHLVEQELAIQFDISRGPIREAIRILAAEGLVELRKNKGAIVITPSMDDVLEIYAIRMNLGAIAIDQLARSAAVEKLDLSKLHALLELMKDQNLRQSNAAMTEADLNFQNELVALTGLSRISESLEKSAIDIRICIKALNIKYDEVDHTNLVQRHTNLLAQIQNGDADGAVDSWMDHIRKSVSEFSKNLSPQDLNEFFDRPLMRGAFELSTKRSS